MLSAITGNWWAPAASGVVAILVAIVAFVWPTKTFEALVLLVGIYAFVRGSIWLAFGLLAADARERWWPLVVNGVVGIAFGVLAFAETRTMAVAMVSLIGAWAVLAGVLEIVAAIRFRRVIPNEFLLGMSGVLQIAFGVVILAQPSIGAASLAFLFGIYAALLGLAQIWLGLQLKRLGDSASRVNPAAESVMP